ncbi:hypothetical protein GCM10029963_63080 [Micromonospora andamanensis]
MLLLHGFPQHSGEWDGVLPALHTAGLRSYALNQRGYSPQARPAEVEAYRLGELVADAAAVLDALGVPAAHVVGHDWGAVVGWALAATHPDRVRTLTAVSVPHPAAMAYALTHDPQQKARSAYMLLFRQPGWPRRRCWRWVPPGCAGCCAGSVTTPGWPRTPIRCVSRER